jgi:putative inorganic carbon (HCO3(-)) transporter
MNTYVRRGSYYLVFGSAVSILFSIALSQILLALSLIVLLLSDEKLVFPPIRLPLTVFFLSTVLAVLFSVDPQRGTPQLRKFFIFAIILVISSTFKSVRQIQALVLAWAGAGSLSALLGLSQFLHRRQEALEQHAANYAFFLDNRITGFASHWATFSGEEMIVLLMLASFLLFAARRKEKAVAWPLLLILFVAITLGMTRAVFLLGMPLGLMYLLWCRSRMLVAALPVATGIVFLATPAAIHERIVSVMKPHGDVDSNAHHAVCRIVGWEMVKAHPWLGLGPEQIGKQFDRYIPAKVSRPLPKGWYGHLHNIYLQYAAERGIVGLVGILWLIGKCLLDFLRHLRSGLLGPEARFILHGAVAVIVAVLAEGLFDYNLGDSEVLTLILSVIACSYVAIKYGVVSAVRAGDAVGERVSEPVLCGLRSMNN